MFIADYVASNCEITPLYELEEYRPDATGRLQLHVVGLNNALALFFP